MMTQGNVSLSLLSLSSLPVSTIRSHSYEESQEKRKHGKYMSCLLENCDPPLVVFVMLLVYELLKWADMDREAGEITFSVTALSVYAVSCLFFMFLVASLYIIGLTPWRACLRYNIIGRMWRVLFIISFSSCCRRERSSDNLDQAQEECIKWVIQRDNKRWEDTDTELTTYKKHIIFYLLFLLVNWYLFEITTRGNIFYHQTWPIRLLLCLLCLWVWCFQCNNAYIQRK